MLGNPLARTEELVVQEAGDELLIYDLRINKAICLNQTSATIWQNCDGNTDTREIAAKLATRHGGFVNEELIMLAIDQLNENCLLENKTAIKNGFAGLSRREVIRKVGFASAVALPVVMSLVAPPAAFAQSCAPPGVGLCVANQTLANMTCCSGSTTQIPPGPFCSTPNLFFVCDPFPPPPAPPPPRPPPPSP